MRKFLILVIVLQLFLSSFLKSQSTDDTLFAPPLRIPLLLAGDYGELREGHFHAGLDIKTMEVTGKKVYAAQDGYVSRIKVEIRGYGRVLYITHPNGYTTVYGHLDHFIPELQKYLVDSQYAEHSYTVNLFPPKDMFVVKKGQQIAWSGNTGGATGPHLHFEIRRTSDQVPMNGLLFKFPIADHRSPEFRTLVVYSLPQDQSIGNDGEIRKMYPVRKQNDTLYTVPGEIVGRYNYIAFASEVYDFFDGSTNRCGIYKLALSVDNKPKFSFVVNAIPFDLTRYVNAHMDYDLKTFDHMGVHRLFMLPNNKLPIYRTDVNQGIFRLENDSVHHGLIVATDAYGNKAYLRFTFRRAHHIHVDHAIRDPKDLVKWDEGKTFKNAELTINIPAACLYRDIYFDYGVSGNSKNIMDDTIKLDYDTEPLQKNINVQLDSLNVPDRLKGKVIFSRVERDGKLKYEGGEWYHGKFTLFTREFGNYVLKIDTIAPVITPVDFVQNKKYYDGQQLIFHVNEELSDIKEYNAYINQHWVVLVYDPRDQSLTCPIDEERIHKDGAKQHLKIVVSDNANNVGTFEGEFYL